MPQPFMLVYQDRPEQSGWHDRREDEKLHSVLESHGAPQGSVAYHINTHTHKVPILPLNKPIPLHVQFVVVVPPSLQGVPNARKKRIRRPRRPK